MKSISLTVVLAAFIFLLPQGSSAQTFTASTAQSDYYIYFTWTSAWNACITWPWSHYHFKYNKDDASDVSGITYGAVAASGVTQPANTGTDYKHAIGPGQSHTYYAYFRHVGWSCDYGGEQYISGTTSNMYPPGTVSATTDIFDTKVVVTWIASTTHVPADKYQYRIYRDGVLKATVSSSTLTWTDNSPVAGVTYTYGIECYASDWGNTSTRSTATGRAFDLNVQTQSLSSGVRISWNGETSPDMNFQRFNISRKDGNNAAEYLTTIPTPSATSWTDPNTAGVPWPGYTYTYIVTPDNNAGTSYRADSANGNRLPDGSVSGYVKAPLGGGGVQGVVVTVTRLDTVVQGDSCWNYKDTTDANGYYNISGIYYYTEADFTITPSMVNHGFKATSENRTLTLSSHTLTNIDFTDTSSFTIGCEVVQPFAGRNAHVRGAEVKVDGVARGYLTAADGKVLTTVGSIGTHTLSVGKTKHGFLKSDTVLNITDNISNLVFVDTTTHNFSGTVSGPCGIYIGTADLHVYDSAATVDTLIKSTQTGNFSVRLPARDYKVKMTGFTPEGDVGVHADSVTAYFINAVSFSLDTADANHAFVYRKPPKIKISGMKRRACAGVYDSMPMFVQNVAETLTIEVRENFGTATCLVDSGFVVVTHDMDGGISVTDTLELNNGSVKYVAIAGLPNIVSPYTYNFSVTAFVGSASDLYTTPVLVIGHRPRTQTYTTVSPSIPFTILRDPPGDASSSYLAAGSEHSSSISISAKAEGTLNLWAQAKLGAEYEAGQFVMTTFSAWGTLKNSFTIGASLASTTELAMTMSNSSKVSTAGNKDIVGNNGDVFVGAALNLVYAVTDVIKFDTASCGVVKSKELMMGPAGFHTTFMYTEEHIRNTLIPQLTEMCSLYTKTNTDSATIYSSQIAVWENMLDYNDSLKQNADLIENRSFSAGVNYESDETITTSATETIDFTTYIEQSIAAEVGIEVGGSGVSGGAEVKFRMDFGVSGTFGSSQTRSTGFVLSDDDAGDYFSVDIKKDPVYATPVFKTVAGRSSCPWEKNTQSRDGVKLAADTVSRSGISSTDAAVFTLKLANLSQSGEGRSYNLEFNQASNPNGALITVGGSQIQAGIPLPFSIPADSMITTTVTVRKGPTAFDYRDLLFSLSSSCDGSISSELKLNALFCDTCNKTNHAPVITTTSMDTAKSGMVYFFKMNATDADGDSVMWYLLKGPDSMRVNVMNGVIAWNPQSIDIGQDTIRVRATDGAKSDTAEFVLTTVKGPETGREDEVVLPEVLSLTAAPNPFNPAVTLRVAIPAAIRQSMRLSIYSIDGKAVQSWQLSGAGNHSVVWRGCDASGKMLSTGLYVVRLTGASSVMQKKLLFTK
ncbi:MAG: T9SS type A sorting domain-containing protein [Fibrobacteres bacterium]|nr:T9SS type A sorting domain-containing protein [Fibrobacterota bacterium]